MIDLQKYTELLQSGLILDHYNVLVKMRDGEDLPKSKRVLGFINFLNKKGYIEDGNLTEEALLLIENTSVTSTTTQPTYTEFTKWVMGLHKKLQNRLVELTGRKQVRGKIGGSPTGYSFIPNVTDMEKNLRKVITIYKLKDTDRIERCLLKHIETCYDNKNWFPIVSYYIFKNNSSQMVTDLDGLDDVEEARNDDLIVNI